MEIKIVGEIPKIIPLTNDEYISGGLTAIGHMLNNTKDNNRVYFKLADVGNDLDETTVVVQLEEIRRRDSFTYLVGNNSGGYASVPYSKIHLWYRHNGVIKHAVPSIDDDDFHKVEINKLIENTIEKQLRINLKQEKEKIELKRKTNYENGLKRLKEYFNIAGFKSEIYNDTNSIYFPQINARVYIDEYVFSRVEPENWLKEMDMALILEVLGSIKKCSVEARLNYRVYSQRYNRESIETLYKAGNIKLLETYHKKEYDLFLDYINNVSTIDERINKLHEAYNDMNTIVMDIPYNYLRAFHTKNLIVDHCGSDRILITHKFLGKPFTDLLEDFSMKLQIRDTELLYKVFENIYGAEKFNTAINDKKTIIIE